MVTGEDWEPGDPLYERGETSQYEDTWLRPMFEILDQYEGESAATARWPKPVAVHDLDQFTADTLR